jgi:hypothetical protein
MWTCGQRFAVKPFRLLLQYLPIRTCPYHRLPLAFSRRPYPGVCSTLIKSDFSHHATHHMGAGSHQPNSIRIANPSVVNRYHEKLGVQSFACNSTGVTWLGITRAFRGWSYSGDPSSPWSSLCQWCAIPKCFGMPKTLRWE